MGLGGNVYHVADVLSLSSLVISIEILEIEDVNIVYGELEPTERDGRVYYYPTESAIHSTSLFFLMAFRNRRWSVCVLHLNTRRGRSKCTRTFLLRFVRSFTHL